VSDRDDGVISILDRLNKAEQQITPVTIVGETKSWDPNPETCQHRTYAVDKVLPKVTCGECGEVLDPYYALRLVGKYFDERDHRWDAIKEHEKLSAQYAEAELHRVRPYESRQFGIPEGAYCTRRARYVVQHTPKGWVTEWDGTPVRTTGTLSAAKTFIRGHVRANWGKEPARSLAQREASQRGVLPEIAAKDEPEKPVTISTEIESL
jgi:hypothetical protein